MARKEQLRRQRTATVINVTAAKQETDLIQALMQVEIDVNTQFDGLDIGHKKQWLLKDIVTELRHTYPESDFHHHFDTSAIRPDGGVLYLARHEGALVCPILIAEVKNQGTNDLRAKEGKAPQARGNAIERLGKNLIGLRIALKREGIFPFVCFGYGCDFEPSSSILDRVSTMAMFGRLNTTYLHDTEGGVFDRGSFYFREEPWTVREMADVMRDIAIRSVHYYISKYGEDNFRNDRQT